MTLSLSANLADLSAPAIPQGFFITVKSGVASRNKRFHHEEKSSMACKLQKYPTFFAGELERQTELFPVCLSNLHWKVGLHYVLSLVTQS
jgi:hypothetical protein